MQQQPVGFILTHIWSGGCLGTPTRHRHLLLGSQTASTPTLHVPSAWAQLVLLGVPPTAPSSLSMNQSGSVQSSRKLTE